MQQPLIALLIAAAPLLLLALAGCSIALLVRAAFGCDDVPDREDEDAFDRIRAHHERAARERTVS